MRFKKLAKSGEKYFNVGLWILKVVHQKALKPANLLEKCPKKCALFVIVIGPSFDMVTGPKTQRIQGKVPLKNVT